MTERSAEQVGHLDEGTIHAWLDGALNADEARAAEAHVAGCAECAAAVAEARGLIAGASRILLALDDVPGGVLPASRDEATATPEATAPAAAPPTAPTAPTPTVVTGVTPLVAARRSRRPFLVSRLRVAAGILIAALGTTVVVREASRERSTAARDTATFSTAVMRRESPQAPIAMTVPAAAPTEPSAPAAAAASAELAPPSLQQPSQVAASAQSARPTENLAVTASPRASSVRISAPSSSVRAEKSVVASEAANAADAAAAAAPPAGLAAPRRAMARANEETRSVPAAKAAAAPTAGYLAHAGDSMARAAVAAPAAPAALSVLRQAATPRPVTVAGVVRDVQGNPLPGVSVTLGKLDVGAVTDSGGHYAIVDVPPGRYVAQARRIGYAMATSDVAVAPVAGRDTTAGPAFTLAPRSLRLSEAVVTGAPTAPPVAARRKTAGAVAGGGAGSASAAERAAAGCYDLGAARPALGLPMQIVLDTTRAPLRDDDESGGLGRTVRTPGAGGGAPAGYPHAYWQFVGDEVLVFFLDARDAGVVLRARAGAIGLRGTASVVAPGRPDVPVAGEVVAPRCGR